MLRTPRNGLRCTRTPVFCSPRPRKRLLAALLDVVADELLGTARAPEQGLIMRALPVYSLSQGDRAAACPPSVLIMQHRSSTGVMRMVELDVLLSRQDIANHFGVSLATVDRIRAAGDFPQPVRIGHSLRWRTEDIIAWAQPRPIGPGHSTDGLASTLRGRRSSAAQLLEGGTA